MTATGTAREARSARATRKTTGTTGSSGIYGDDRDGDSEDGGTVTYRTATAAAGEEKGAGERAGDAGISTIEVVIIAPVLILFILVLVAFGQLADARGELDGAARDAARAGSLHGNHAKANTAARQTATQDLQHICSGPIRITHDNTRWAPGGVYTVQVSCSVRGLSDLGLPITTTLSSEFASPLDPYRRFE